MRMLTRTVIAQVLCVILLLPMSLKTMGPPGGHRPEGPPFGSPHDFSERPPEMHRNPMGPPGGMNRMNPSGPSGREGMPGRNMRGHEEPGRIDSHQGEHMPTHVVSGVDTDFKEQESIDHAVDTINAKSGGNWLLKRVWWEKTEEVYEQIKEVFNKVMDTRMRFISDYNKLNRSLDIFYSEIGIEQGPLRDLLSHAQDLMSKEEKEQGYLNKREQAFVFKLKGKDRDLEQLKLDVKAIQELDAKLDESFEMLFKQIDVCNQYEQKAWDNFKEIARELNDKEARKLYYDTEGLHNDIKKVSEYISGSFATYFNQTIQSAHDHTAKISSQMNALKNEGIDLVKQAEILEKDEDPAPKKVVEKVKKPVAKGWWYNLGESVGKFIDTIISFIPKSVRLWFSKDAKKAESEYAKLKKDVEKDNASIEKEANKVEKWAESDIKSVEKVAGQLERSGEADMKSVKQEAQRIEKSVFGELTDAQKKELGVNDTSKHKPHAVIKYPDHVQHQSAHVLPSMPHATMPTPPRREVHHAPPMERPQHELVRPKKDHTLEHMPHRPLHAPEPRRSITDHFQSPQPQHEERHNVRSMERPSHEQHNFNHNERQQEPRHTEPNHNPTHAPHHDFHRVNALQPGTLGS